jgi:hypothetical protein
MLDEGDLSRRKVHVDALIRELHDLGNEGEWNSATALRALKASSAIAALLSSGGIGECRLDTPYSALQPVLDANGLRWCCSHDPQHWS